MIRNRRTAFTASLAALILAVSAGATLLLLLQVDGSSGHTAIERSTPAYIDSAVAGVSTDTRDYGLPVRLSIPKIGVNAAIAFMGLTSAGDMEAPATNEGLGWYKYGPRPGNTGSAVIAGHLGVGTDAVFANLGELAVDDTMSLTDDAGRVVSFVVTGTRMYDQDMEPAEVFTSSSGAHLNLITCNGEWNPERNTYNQRLVVFTDRQD